MTYYTCVVNQYVDLMNASYTKKENEEKAQKEKDDKAAADKKALDEKHAKE